MNLNDFPNAKHIVGFPGYAITSCGKVLSLPRKIETKHPITKKSQFTQIKVAKVLKTTLNKRGHTKVYLCIKGRKNTCYVKNIVAQHFLNKPKGKKNLIIWHLDENKQNNAVSNLDYVEFKTLCLLTNSVDYRNKLKGLA